MKAPDICKRAADLMADRGKERDQSNGERSMARCVHTFNAMTGHSLSVEDGWLFMVYLKHARMRGGNFKMDDYEDAVAYEALMAEEAIAEAPVLTPYNDYTFVVPEKVVSGPYGDLLKKDCSRCPPHIDLEKDCSRCPHPCK